MTVQSKIDIGILSFFEMTPDLVCIATKEGYFESVNPAAVKKLEYTLEELYSKPIFSFIHPEDIVFTGEKRASLIEGKALVNFQNRYISKSGKVVWLEWTSIYLPDKELVFAIAKDITERKQKEIEIEAKYNKFKSLANHFKSHVEEDRKYFALELHEELAQLVAAIKMNISWMKLNATDMSEAFSQRMEEVSMITDLFIKTIRRISFSISPNMLEDFGFNATAESLCNEFSLLNNISCNFESTCKEEDISAEVKIDFFRICQEALDNISQHATAKNVTVSIEHTGKKLSLSISDDGKGFDMSNQTITSGINKMQQRAASLNSELIVKSEKGKGTSLYIELEKV